MVAPASFTRQAQSREREGGCPARHRQVRLCMQLTRRVSVESRRASVCLLERYGFIGDFVAHAGASVESRWNQCGFCEDFARHQFGNRDDSGRNRQGGNKYSLYSGIPADSAGQRRYRAN